MSNILPSRPLVGRTYELEVLGEALASAQGGTGAAVFLKGDTGTGKSRLASAVVEQANRLGFDTVSGQAYRMDTGVPYGLWSNAFFPMLREMDDATLSVLTRGGEEELSIVIPGLRGGRLQDPVFASGDPAELRTRIHWNFTGLMRGLSKRTPLLVVLDDLHWSDPSGLDLFHFVSRQIAEVPLVLLGVYNTKELVHNPAFQKMERPLLSVSGSEALDVGPLSADETVDLVLRTFQVDAGIGEPLARQIHERAGGNRVLRGLGRESVLRTSLRRSPRRSSSHSLTRESSSCRTNGGWGGRWWIWTSLRRSPRRCPPASAS